MISEQFYQSIVKRRGQLETVMYEYGICCAKQKELNIDVVKKTLARFDFDANETSRLVGFVMKGFCKGL